MNWLHTAQVVTGTLPKDTAALHTHMTNKLQDTPTITELQSELSWKGDMLQTRNDAKSTLASKAETCVSGCTPENSVNPELEQLRTEAYIVTACLNIQTAVEIKDALCHKFKS